MNKYLELELLDFSKIKFICDSSTLKMIKRETKFIVDNYYIIQRNAPWAKKYISVIDTYNNIISIGLLENILDIAKRNNCEISLKNKNKFKKLKNKKSNIDPKQYLCESFLEKINYKLRNYQNKKSFNYYIRNKRGILNVNPGAGKSLLIYLLMIYIYNEKINFDDTFEKERIVFVAPNKSLVLQMKNDFNEYSDDKYDDKIGVICSGMKKKYKTWDKPIIFITTASLKKGEEYFLSIKGLFYDEAHGLESGTYNEKKISETLDKLTECEYRYGFTGSIGNLDNKDKSKDDINANKLHFYRVKRHFGKVLYRLDYKESIDLDYISDFKIYNIFYNYMDYDQIYENAYSNYEMCVENISEIDKRTYFLKTIIKNNYIKKTDNSFFVFFNLKSLNQFKKYLEDNYDFNIRILDGSVKNKQREEIRNEVSNNPNGSFIVLGTYKLISVGLNIPSLNNIFIIDGIKKFSLLKQIIGRIVRKQKSKTLGKCFLLINDIRYRNERNGAIKESVLLKQGIDRIKSFENENYDYENILIDKNLNELKLEDDKYLNRKIKKIQMS